MIREDVIDRLPETSAKRFKAAWPLNMGPIGCHEIRYLPVNAVKRPRRRPKEDIFVILWTVHRDIGLFA